MKRGNTVNYFGRKCEKNLDMTRGLMPPGNRIGTIVDGCFGSGAVTIGLFSLYDAAKVGIDMDKTVINLHRTVRDKPSEVREAIYSLEYSRECYDKCLETLERFERGEEKDEVLAAASKYAVLYMSRNSMQGIFRGISKYNVLLDREKARIYWNMRQGLYEKAEEVILGGGILSDVDLVQGDFMDYAGYWEDPETFLYLDVPYPLEGRGIHGKRNNTGYATDWTDSDQGRFLDYIVMMHGSGRLKAQTMICSNFEVDECGGLMGLRESIYNQVLMPMGFRLVVTELKYACEKKKDGGGKKRRKAEVVWINYRDIAGLWNGYTYYDYEDIF